MRSWYRSSERPRVAQTVEDMPNARYIIFHATNLSAGEEEILDAYFAWDFCLGKVVYQQGTREKLWSVHLHMGEG